MGDELKYCPFCGSDKLAEFWNDNNLYQINCRDCGCMIARKTIAEAETAWNRRFTPPEIEPKTEQIKEILDYLSEARRKMTGNSALRGYKATAPYKRLITARMREGHSIDDFKLVIDHKATTWKGTKFQDFVRPSTLFSATHFPEYLCEAESVKKKALSQLDSDVEGLIE